MTVYVIDGVRRLRFQPEVNATFNHYRVGRGAEAGGILLGRVYPSEVVIEAVTAPSSADRAGRFFFNRSREVAQRSINEAWSASTGERIYLGEWHSHPADVAEPSGRDRQMILNMLRESNMHIDFLALVVLGRKKDWVGLAQNGALRSLVLSLQREPSCLRS